MSTVQNDTATSPYAGLGFNTSKPGAAGQGDDSLDQQDFLMLLTTQLKNQDPLKPLDSTQFVTQLAQFSQVSGVQEMNASLAALTAGMKSSAVLDGASLVGRYVLLKGNHATLSDGGVIVGGVTTPTGATSITVSLRNEGGELVRSMQLTPTADTTLFNWDGRANDGTVAPSGRYTLDATATVSGVSQATDTLIADLVSSVSIEPGTFALTLNTPGAGAVTLADVRQVF
ncbi:MAG TPA: flagellar hook assembly protein FlgD [Steroidobacteraceae bacterium]|nr:flagellar hook assembly protein FlgD [Steroidobacteraceae bacterium]HQX77742.1 flagellar hook assembly protein FlgD [Steroidobacteraceae bacterium]HQZ79659.1 flagellar hook assembly protein FlgD [Steroidobacteraceae bacterium]